MLTMGRCFLALLVVLAACGDDADGSEASTGEDASADIGATADASADAPVTSDAATSDAGSFDVGPPDDAEADAATLQDAGLPEDAAVFNPPMFTTSAPVIHLADNLDEESDFGFCIDTIGRGFGDRLHAHSCKPPGSDEDVRYSFDTDSGQIASAGFEGFCMEALVGETNAFGLVDCDASRSAQRFDYDAGTLEFHPRGDDSMCMSVGAESRPAGTWMARDLLLEPCAGVDPLLKSWVIFPE